MEVQDTEKNRVVIEADLGNEAHQQAIIQLINVYRTDPMGGELPPIIPELSEQLLLGLQQLPTSFVHLAYETGSYTGMAICFIGFSTFHARQLINIHDLIVLPQSRGKGIGRMLLTSIETKARQMRCCKVTLEVRTDNGVAQHLYKACGFSAGESPMYFWTKTL